MFYWDSVCFCFSGVSAPQYFLLTCGCGTPTHAPGYVHLGGCVPMFVRFVVAAVSDVGRCTRYISRLVEMHGLWSVTSPVWLWDCRLPSLSLSPRLSSHGSGRGSHSPVVCGSPRSHRHSSLAHSGDLAPLGSTFDRAPTAVRRRLHQHVLTWHAGECLSVGCWSHVLAPAVPAA